MFNSLYNFFISSKSQLFSRNKLKFYFGYFFQYSFSLSFSLILIPILAQKIGFSIFGQIGELLSLTSLLIVLINYSFSVTAVPKIAIEENILNRNSLFNLILTSKLSLSIFSILTLYFFSSYFEISLVVFIILAVFLISSSLNSSWYLQGVQKFNVIISLSILSTIISFIFFLFLNYNILKFSIEHVMLVILMPQFLINILSFFYTSFDLKIEFIFHKITKLLASEFFVFLSQSISALYIMVGPIVIVYFSNNFEAGIFSLMERVNNLFLGGFLVIFSVLLPTLSINYKKNKKVYINQLKNIFILYFLITLVLSVLFQIFKPIILIHLFKSTETKFSVLVYLSFFYLSISSLGPLMTNHFVLINQKNKILVVNSTIFILTFLSSYLLVGSYGAIGWLMSSIIGQLILFILFISVLSKSLRSNK